MTTNQYQELAMTTLNKEIPQKDLLLNASMGLCGESGEVVDLLKKHLFQGHELNIDKVIDELGDIAWYLAEAATALNIDLEDILKQNVEKLKKRYPEGFESDKSIHRKE